MRGMGRDAERDTAKPDDPAPTGMPPTIESTDKRAGPCGAEHERHLRTAIGVSDDQVVAAIPHRLAGARALVAHVDRRNGVAIDKVVVAVVQHVAGKCAGCRGEQR